MPNNEIEQIINLMFDAKRLTQFNLGKQEFSPLHMRTLYFIANNSKVVMKDIADLFGITPPSATSLVNGMVKSGLIKRSARETDRRVVQLKITSKGSSLLTTGFAHFKKRIRQALSSLTSQERKMLFGIMKKLSANSKFN